jgi:hypothetical protein
VTVAEYSPWSSDGHLFIRDDNNRKAECLLTLLTGCEPSATKRVVPSHLLLKLRAKCYETKAQLRTPNRPLRYSSAVTNLCVSQIENKNTQGRPNRPNGFSTATRLALPK